LGTARQRGAGDEVGGGSGPDERLAAGRFSSWLVSVEGAIRGEHGSEVPCGECTACCTSSHFIPIEPDEVDTLAHVPEALRFPAPGRPHGHVLMGYDERGHCPMLVDNRCSIYDHRPRVCRSYDCRIFAASGTEVDELDEGIGQRARRWRFELPTDTDRAEYQAVRLAGAFLDEQGSRCQDLDLPVGATQRAALAVALHSLFLERDPKTETVTVVVPDPEVLRTGLDRLLRS
jgi:Fe-S-cluster containining protein